MRASCLDIGGSRVRVYDVKDVDRVVRQREVLLPRRRDGQELHLWSVRRVEAIAEFIRQWDGPLLQGFLPTACAGRKDPERGSVVESTYASPLPSLVDTVFRQTGVRIGQLYDDDVCAGWGHRISSRGGLFEVNSDTLLLTAGTGVAECLWVDGAFLPKGSYPRLAELDLEEHLRADAWRDQPLPLEALRRLLQARGPNGAFRRVVLSGRFADRQGWPEQLTPEVELRICPLEEAPALGALALYRRDSASVSS